MRHFCLYVNKKAGALGTVLGNGQRPEMAGRYLDRPLLGRRRGLTTTGTPGTVTSLRVGGFGRCGLVGGEAEGTLRQRRVEAGVYGRDDRCAEHPELRAPLVDPAPVDRRGLQDADRVRLPSDHGDRDELLEVEIVAVADGADDVRVSQHPNRRLPDLD